jgi:GAF domain-containing protein
LRAAPVLLLLTPPTRAMTGASSLYSPWGLTIHDQPIRAISTAILAGTDPGELLGLVVGHARALVGADLATLALPTGDDRMAVEAADGLLAEQLRGTVFPAEGSVTGEVVRTGKAVVLADAAADDRSAQPIVGAGVGPALFVPWPCVAAPSAP